MDNNQGGIQNVQGAADQPQANIYNQQPVDGQQQYMQQQYYQQQYDAQSTTIRCTAAVLSTTV